MVCWLSRETICIDAVSICSEQEFELTCSELIMYAYRADDLREPNPNQLI